MAKSKIRFRPMNEEDLEETSVWLEDFEDVAMFDRSLPLPVGKKHFIESWKPSLEYENQPTALWYIVEAEDGTSLAMCGLQTINYIHGDAVLPVFVSKNSRNKGLGSIMIATMIDLAFDRLRLHRVSTVYRSGYEPSEKLMANTGFQVEGVIREGWYGHGKHHDIIKVGLLKSEWPEKRKLIKEQLSVSSYTW